MMTLFPSPLVASSPTNQKDPRSPVDLESGCGRMERLVEGRRGVMEGEFADCKADVPEGFIVFGPSANPPSTHTLHTHTLSLLRLLLLVSTRAHARSLLLLRSDEFV